MAMYIDNQTIERTKVIFFILPRTEYSSKFNIYSGNTVVYSSRG